MDCKFGSKNRCAKFVTDLLCDLGKSIKTLMLGKTEGRRRRGRQNEMVGWHHQLSGYESEQTPEDSEGQVGWAYCSPWGHKESDRTERLNNKHVSVRALMKFWKKIMPTILGPSEDSHSLR